MGTGLPFIFQIVLLLLLPLAFVYLTCATGVLLLSVRAALTSRFRHGRSDPPATPQ